MKKFTTTIRTISIVALQSQRGFTLIETLVAISLLSVAIVAPMSLTSQSLSAAYYARDEITAFNLAQEGLEAVRAVRDGQVLQISQSADASAVDLFGSIPKNTNFTIDSRFVNPPMSTCSGTCPRLQTSLGLYGYDADTITWVTTNFTRTVLVCYLQTSGQCGSTVTDEVRVSVTVSWPAAGGRTRTFTIYDNLYRWINDGSAAS